MLLPAVVPVLAGLLVGTLIGLLARAKLRLTPGRAALAGAAAVVLTWLLVSELTSEAVRAFWQRHPSWNATVTGVTLLGLTVLIVERVVEREFAKEQDRRWRPAARAACEAVLLAVAEPIGEQRNYIYWRSSQVDGRYSEGVSVHGEPRSAPAMRQAVLAVTPVMTATERLHELYALAWAAVQAAADLDRATAEDPWAVGGITEPRAPWEEASDILAWWTGVSSQWDRLGDATRTFEDTAEELLGELRLWDEDPPPWREPEPPGFARSLRSFREEFPGLEPDHRDPSF
jgi:hypothetical protein